MHKNVAGNPNQMMEKCTSMNKLQFSIIYLRCWITHARKRKVFYLDLIKKVKDKIPFKLGRVGCFFIEARQC